MAGDEAHFNGGMLKNSQVQVAFRGTLFGSFGCQTALRELSERGKADAARQHVHCGHCPERMSTAH
jgi:hypothetical protein